MANHEYWRLRCSNLSAGRYVNIAKLEMRGSIGGADQCSGGTASASSQYSSQAASLAFDGNNSTYWESDDPGSGGIHWVKYQFSSPVDVAEIVVRNGPFGNETPVTFYLEYSDDNSSWTAVLFENYESGWATSTDRTFVVNQAGNNVYWRLNITDTTSSTSLDIAEVELFSVSGGSDICAGGKASASSTVTNSFATFGPEFAFDNSNSTLWGCGAPGDGTGWLRYRLSSGVDVVEYSIRASPNFTVHAPTDWTLEKSLDGINWTVMDTQAGVSGWTSGERRVFTLALSSPASRPVLILLGL